MNAVDLTHGERLRIARRRRGSSQLDAADYYDVTLYRYRKWEDDAEEPPAEAKPKLGKLRDFEACHVLRVRRGVELQNLAAALDMTPNWLCEIERGRQPAAKLVRYWGRALRTRTKAK
jgi:transcriptional regulator with XRE-family HTH domain